MLLCPLTTFLCSHRVPLGVSSLIVQWVEGLSVADTCVVCGNLTNEERFTLSKLIDRGIPVVLTLAKAIPENIDELQLSPSEMSALASGRLVIISPITDASVTDTTGKTSAARNLLMITVADQIVVGFMADNGNLARQLLGKKNLTILQPEGQYAVKETDAQKLENNETQMGWAIYRRLKEGQTEQVESEEDTAAQMPWEGKLTAIPSVEVRKLLAQYLKLEHIQRPSLLHSLLLFQVVKYYSLLSDFDFTTFFRMWGVQNLRPEDWKATKVNGRWLPSLAERVLTRLFRALPSKFKQPLNPNEKFDPQLAHALLDVFLARPRQNQQMLKRALNLAYFEHNQEAINLYKGLLSKNSK